MIAKQTNSTPVSNKISLPQSPHDNENEGHWTEHRKEKAKQAAVVSSAIDYKDDSTPDYSKPVSKR